MAQTTRILALLMPRASATSAAPVALLVAQGGAGCAALRIDARLAAASLAAAELEHRERSLPAPRC